MESENQEDTISDRDQQTIRQATTSGAVLQNPENREETGPDRVEETFQPPSISGARLEHTLNSMSEIQEEVVSDRVVDETFQEPSTSGVVVEHTINNMEEDMQTSEEPTVSVTLQHINIPLVTNNNGEFEEPNRDAPYLHFDDTEDDTEDDIFRADSPYPSSSDSSDMNVDIRDIVAQPRGNYIHSIVEELMQIRQNHGDSDHLRHRIQRVLFSLQSTRNHHRPYLVQPENETENTDQEPSPEPENPVSFDTNLPTEHSYLGTNMDRVSGVNYLEVGQTYNLMIFMHEHIIFPGEVLPFMISTHIFDDGHGDNDAFFGVCFPFLSERNVDESIYGVTCQIYEKGTDARGNTLIKCRALQRFVAKNQFNVPLDYIASQPHLKSHVQAQILPDIYLPEPLKAIDMGSMNRFRDNATMRQTFRRYQASTTIFPPYVYDPYSITTILAKAQNKLQHKIESIPTDPVQLSFWLVRNLHLSEDLMHKSFLFNSVNQRLMLVEETLKDEPVFTCRYCGHIIANCSESFAMSKHGVQTQYCNSAGYIHETNTLYNLLPDAVMFSGDASSEFSWFPGYEWRIIVCKICKRHCGWKFTATEPNLIPKKFYGISSSSVRVTSKADIPTEGSDIYRRLLQLTSNRN